MQILKRVYVGIAGFVFASLTSTAFAAPVATVCGAPINSVTRTNIDPFVTNSEQPVNLGGVQAQVNVPAGSSRCVRVRFSAVANCPLACFLRVFANETELNPAWFSSPLRFSQDATNGGSAHSFEWVARLGPGQYAIRIKVQTGNTVQNASIGPYTATVEITR